MVMFTNKALGTPAIVRILGERFRDYRMLRRMTRKEVAVSAGVGMTTIYKFETGKMTDLSLGTVLRLLRAIGLWDNWENLLPLLPESPYLYDDKGKKAQRIRHSNKK